MVSIENSKKSLQKMKIFLQEVLLHESCVVSGTPYKEALLGYNPLLSVLCNLQKSGRILSCEASNDTVVFSE